MAHVVGGVQHRVQRGVERGRERGAGVLRAGRKRWKWFDHLGRAYERYNGQRGDRLAAALTFYGFLAFFPLVALAFAITGYAVAINPHAEEYVTRALGDLLPGMTDQLKVKDIAAAKAGAGIIALFGLAWAGLGWIGVWRESLRTIWKIDPTGGGNYFVKKLWDVAVLLLLGLALLASVAVSSLATSATHTALTWVGLAHVTGAGTLLRIVAIGVALAADAAIFFVLFSRLSGTQASWRRLVRGCLFGAVGFEILKLAGTFLIGHTTRNPVYASFAVIVGLLVWMNLLSRFTLFTAAWTATRRVIMAADAEDTENTEEVKDAKDVENA